MKKTLYLQGVARHSKAEILSFIEEAVKSLSVLVGDKGFLEGRANGANACLFGLLVSVFNGPEMSAHWYKEVIKYPNLRKFTVEMAEKYFPERKIVDIQAQTKKEETK